MNELSEKSNYRIVDIEITSQNIALNCMVKYLALAQKTGAFTIEESAHIMECIKQFKEPLKDPTSQKDAVQG